MDRPFRCLVSLRPRGFRSVSAIAAILIAVASTPAAGQESLLWGGLEPGPHAVGYRVLYEFDHTRQYDLEFTTDPARSAAHQPRPILICAWYPARKTDIRPMEYGQYLDVSSADVRLADFARRLAHKA